MTCPGHHNHPVLCTGGEQYQVLKERKVIRSNQSKGQKTRQQFINIHMEGCSIRCHPSVCSVLRNFKHSKEFKINSRLVLLGQSFGNDTKKVLSSLLSVSVHHVSKVPGFHKIMTH